MSDLGLRCPQCNRNLVVSPTTIEMFNEWCDDCGAEIEIDVDFAIVGARVVTRGTNHDEEE